MKAFSIAIEGCDGAGKATQVELLVKMLKGKGYKVIQVSFPRYTETWAGKLLWEALKSDRRSNYDFLTASPQAASLLYAADRLESVPWLNQLAVENDVIVYDRAVASNLIHQGGKLATDDERREFANFIERTEYQNGFPRPDLTFFLSLPAEVSIARAKKRAEELGQNVAVGEDDENYLRNSHQSAVFYAQEDNWTVIDGVQDGRALSPEEIHGRILEEVIQKIPMRK